MVTQTEPVPEYNRLFITADRKVRGDIESKHHVVKVIPSKGRNDKVHYRILVRDTHLPDDQLAVTVYYPLDLPRPEVIRAANFYAQQEIVNPIANQPRRAAFSDIFSPDTKANPLTEIDLFFAAYPREARLTGEKLVQWRLFLDCLESIKSRPTQPREQQGSLIELEVDKTKLTYSRSRKITQEDTE